MMNYYTDAEQAVTLERVALQEVAKVQRELRRALTQYLDDECLRDSSAPLLLSGAVIGELMNIVASPERYELDAYGLQP